MKWEKEAKEYLKSKYGNEMVLDRVIYDFDNSNLKNKYYFASVYPQNNADINFRVQNYNGYFSDNYLIRCWEYEVSNEITERFKSVTAYIQLSNTSLQKIKLNYKDQIPSFHNIKYLLTEGDQPDLSIKVQFRTLDEDKKFDELLNVFLYLKEKDYHLHKIKLRLSDEKGGTENYIIEAEDLPKIVDVDILKQILI